MDTYNSYKIKKTEERYYNLIIILNMNLKIKTSRLIHYIFQIFLYITR
jgi:hypothetical protein